jgi:hypothetical protein
MYDRIGSFLATSRSPEEINAYMSRFQVSGADIAEARRRMASTYGRVG